LQNGKWWPEPFFYDNHHFYALVPGDNLPYPNPENGVTPLSFTYTLTQPADGVKLKIFTTAFRKILRGRHFNGHGRPTSFCSGLVKGGKHRQRALLLGLNGRPRRPANPQDHEASDSKVKFFGGFIFTQSPNNFFATSTATSAPTCFPTEPTA
jgi:hypothetical protein